MRTARRPGRPVWLQVVGRMFAVINANGLGPLIDLLLQPLGAPPPQATPPAATPAAKPTPGPVGTDLNGAMPPPGARPAGLQMPSASDAEFIRQMYRTYLGREPEAAGLAHHLRLLQSGQMTRGQIETGIANGAEARQFAGRRGQPGVAAQPPGAPGQPALPPTFLLNGPVPTGEQRVKDGPGGFLWKPISDSTGKLAVLLPPVYSGSAVGAKLVGPDGKVLAVGRDGGVGNGDRQHYRFDKPGGAYPPGTTVVVELADGNQATWTVQKTGQRTD